MPIKISWHHLHLPLPTSQTLHLARTTLNPTRLARRGTSRGQTRELRKLIMNEMVEQERGYISSMDTLVSHFINPMVAMETAVPRDLVITFHIAHLLHQF